MLQFNLERFEAARKKARLDPDSLSPTDHEMIAVVDPHFVEEVRRERAAALAPKPPVVQRSAVAVLQKDEDIDEFFERAAGEALPVRYFATLFNVVREKLSGLSAPSNVDEQIRDLSNSLSAANARIKALESRPIGLIYRGVYEPGTVYSKHQAVTSSGSLWICLDGTSERPPSSKWQLAAKRGADGKDLR